MSVSSNKVAIVTGGSRGIGAAVVERLSRDGYAVVVNFAGADDEANALAARLGDAGGLAVPIRADVSNPDDVRLMFNKAEEVLGGIDVLVNNAGIMKLSSLAETSDETFDYQIAVNLKGAFNCLREGAKRVRSGGRIISLSSSVVGLYQPDYASYAATKAGIEAMTHILANEMRGRNVTVNAVAPGPTGTDLFLNGKTSELIQHLARLAPLERLGQPHDIASVVAFLAGSDGSWINGQIIRANGGII